MLYVLAAATGFALLPIITRDIYANTDFVPTDIAIWRFILAVPILWGIIAIRRLPVPQRPLPHLRLMGMGVLYSMAALTAFFSLDTISASMYTVLFFTYPAMVALLSLALGNSLPVIGWMALALTITGVVFTVPDPGALGQGDVRGVIFAFINALLMAVYYIVSRHVLQGHQAVARATAWVMTGGLLFLLLVSLAIGFRMPPDLKTWAELIILAGAVTAMPIFAINTGIQKIGATRAAVIVSIQPVETIIMAVILLGETVTPLQWIGAALIIGGVVLIQTTRNSDRQHQPAHIQTNRARR
jgi:drug/metabolite transporter (DMT)-like permease